MLCKHYPEIKSYQGKHLGMGIQTKRIIPIAVVTLPPAPPAPPYYHSLKNFSNLLIRIQYTFQVGITGKRKMYYANVDFKFPLEVYQCGTT